MSEKETINILLEKLNTGRGLPGRKTNTPFTVDNYEFKYFCLYDSLRFVYAVITLIHLFARAMSIICSYRICFPFSCTTLSSEIREILSY